MPVCAEEETVTKTQKFASCKNNLRNQEQEHADFVKPPSPLYTYTGSITALCLSPPLRAHIYLCLPVQSPWLPTSSWPKPPLLPPEMLLHTPACSIRELGCILPLFQYICYSSDIFCSYHWSKEMDFCSWYLQNTCTWCHWNHHPWRRWYSLPDMAKQVFSFLPWPDDPLRMCFSLAMCNKFQGLGKQLPT